MSDNDIASKEAYFEAQALLDLSDDERDFSNNSPGVVDRALEDSKAMPPPTSDKARSSFLGPTPKERRVAFEAHTTKHRTVTRESGLNLVRSSTAPEAELTKSFPVTKPRSGVSATVEGTSKLKRVASLPDMPALDQTPFYKQIGTIPRELKNGKNVKPAGNIKLEPEHKQLLKGKIVYFYPNDDISMARRTRIHKVIQLGAAWVNRWRDDVTHIMLDDASYTYSQLLRHLNKAGFSRRLALVKFDPYVPQCIEFGTLLDPNAVRFAIKGAPVRSQSFQAEEPSQPSDPSQVSLKIKSSRHQIAAQGTQKTDSPPTEESIPSSRPAAEAPPSSSDSDIVEDSFIVPSSDPAEHIRNVPSAPDRFNDALSQAIKETMALAHLPLDDEDADSPPPTPVDEDDDEGSDEEPSETNRKSRKTPVFVSKASALRGKGLNLNTFQCMDPGSNGYSSDNPNARTIQILDEMCKHYDKMQDQWRTIAYRKGITTLKKQTTKIVTSKQAAALPFIGQRLADKIEEIVLTDRLRKLDSTKDDPLDSVLRLFLGVYGAGLVQANKWIQAGYRTLEDLETKAKLTDSHRVGLEHYNDFNTRIPRSEVEAHGAAVKAALAQIDPEFSATIMGSYRRGANDSGDIDMLITCPGASLSMLRTVVFDSLVPQLFSAGFLKASLATSRSNDPTGTKWHGASCLQTSKVWRRMDLLLVPEEVMGAALIYFTGNDIFNRSIRLLARKKNMRLNQKGLYKDVERGRRGEKLNEGVLVEGRSEKKIFEVLGVPWREPHERIC
ncbi:DNA-directed DNA polymerase [Parastagonospora nodorum]|nr:DNA-directed DNA polymerase [Parastagonospora nodorum]